ncbi:MAG: extracellular solute-binding protein [Butyrivibrio sp.]|nr:extracellular solute-binding protein [Acetatifactor muris]MCM1559424.1 extracellular solute-binding protein [Butyrivibrio sp.]
MKSSVKKAMIAAAVVAAIVLVAVLMSLRGVEDFHDKYAGVDLNTDVEGMEREGTYSGYLNAHAGAVYATQNIEVDLFDYTASGDGEVKKVTDYEGVPEALYTDTGSFVSWEVDVPETGYYNVYMEYLIPESRGVAAERVIYINGEIPFGDARNVSFTRIWTNGGQVRVDNQGNQIRPTQVEVYDWQNSYFRDDRGYITEPYLFYLEQGKNEISLEAENEPMVLRKLVVAAVSQLDSYEEYTAKQPSVSMSEAARNYVQVIEGEDSTIRSESSLYAKYDRSSPTTQPNSVTKTVLNYVGGDAWRSAGQWIEWEFEVPEDGYYNIMFKGRQNYARGSVSNRMVYIDGEIPFSELQAVPFEYSNDWEYKKLADEDGTPFQFYLTAGKHTIRMEAALGGLGSILEDLEDSTFRLNQIYRKILVYTGANPDQYRDYQIQRNYPEIMEAMDLESKRLFKIVDDMVAYSGQKADQIATAQTVAQQMERFCEKPQKITTEFVTFKDNITAVGTATLNMSETKLDIDYLVVSGVDAEVKQKKSNGFMQLWHELKSFGASFVVDYNAVGDVYEEGKEEEIIKVWVLTGRDQGTILKSMVDESFTPDTGIKVNVEIVGADALLNAVIAGRGPNVVLSVGADQPVNYALRNASEDITQFEGWEEVLAPYTPSSYEQYSLDGGIYAIPETQTFNVLFYRTDVLEELGLEVPQTWKELEEMMPTIQGNNLSVGLPTAAGSSSTASATTAVASNTPDLSMYFALLFQNGGDLYNADGTRTTVDTEAGVQAFEDYVKYFNDYGIPTIYDFVSRFRSGEMPIGVQAYSVYNTLMVSAPEIRGLWDFTLIPGTEKTDENGNTYIDRSDFITGAATMMIATDNESLKQKSWEFMKWWADADTQVRFGREIEALLGSSARYNTANRDAFRQLSWSADDIEVLNEQWEQTVGIREVPGGYYTGRHIANAIRKVLNDKDDVRNTIIDYSIKINDEIDKKRNEFGMPVAE